MTTFHRLPIASKSYFLNLINFDRFKREDSSLDRALAECNRIRMKAGFNQGLLLKSVETNPMFPFLHYAVFDSKNNVTIKEDAYLNESKSIFGLYEELFAIQKSSTFIQPSTLPAHRHSGFIISNFKILDRSRVSMEDLIQKLCLATTIGKELALLVRRE